LLLVVCLMLPQAARAEAPAMVTTARGEVQLMTGDTAAELPPLPVLLAPGQSLKLGEGAMVVVLCGGQATKIEGPDTVGLDRLRRKDSDDPAAPGVLADLLSRQTSTRRPAASRGGNLTLLRPAPWTSVLSPSVIRWHCDSCGPQVIDIYDLRADEVLWTGEGTGSVAYGGPELKPGAYYVHIGSRDFPFTVPPVEVQDRVKEALAMIDGAHTGLDTGSVAARIGLEVGVLFAAELHSEALYRLDVAVEAHPDDPDLAKLKADFETRAGLTP